MAPEPAKEFFDAFCKRVRSAYAEDKVEEGVFGAYMDVSLVSEGGGTDWLTVCLSVFGRGGAFLLL